jgi:hypothetical protein
MKDKENKINNILSIFTIVFPKNYLEEINNYSIQGYPKTIRVIVNLKDLPQVIGDKLFCLYLQ